MTGRPVANITTAPPRRRPWGRLRGTWAVTVLLLSALDHLAAAIIGCRPLARTVRRLAAPIAAAWRSASRRPARQQSDPALICVTITERTDEHGRASR